MRILPILFAVSLCCTGCKKKETNVSQNIDKGPHLPLIGAVMHSDTEKVRELASSGIDLNERAPEDQSTPMINAAQTDQWPVVEILIDHGADIWAHDEFGDTTATYILNSRILRDSVEDQARFRVIKKLKAQGFPFPPPDREETLELDKAGKWPPPGVKH